MLDSEKINEEVLDDSTEETEVAQDTEVTEETEVKIEVEDDENSKKSKKKKKNKKDAEIEELKAEVANLKDKFLRNQAELENFKRRSREESQRMLKYATQPVLSDILPVLDSFERALNVSNPSDEMSNFLKGFQMIHDQLVGALNNSGMEVIKTEGEMFDPNLHQAVMQEADESKESGIILQELQKGYKLKDRVIRPAMVKVNE